MYFFKRSAVFLILSMFSLFASAGGYIGVTAFEVDTEAGDFQGVNLVGGVDLNDFIGVRGRYMLSVDDENYQGVTIEIEEMYGVDLKLTLPLSDSFNPYLVIGKTKVEVEASNHWATASDSDTLTSYGVGVQFDVRESLSITAEFMDIDDAEMISLGASLNF